MLASALISAIPALVQGGIGISQMSRAKRLEREAGERPQYEIPESVKAALQIAQREASQRGMPGQAAYEEQIGASTAAARRGLQETGGGQAALLGGLTQLAGGEQDAATRLAQQSAQYYAANQERLRGELGTYGGYEDKQWGLNMYDPYMQSMAAASAMRGAGLQNIYGGVSSGAQGVTGALQHGEMMKMLGDGGDDSISLGGNSNNNKADLLKTLAAMRGGTSTYGF